MTPSSQNTSNVVLETRSISKLFGGLAAVRSVNYEFIEKQAHAIIGPNGAGKSTLVNLLTGHAEPSGGLILYKGQDITGLPAYKITRLGIGRSFQKTNIFPVFSCYENCRLAAQTQLRSSLRFFRNAASYKNVNSKADIAIELCGLQTRRDATAGRMSYGEQRQLELGMVLATSPEILVLDEPLAGMGKEESEKMVHLLKELAKQFTLILVEHDMDAVFSIADVLTVMVNGSILESGPVDTVRASQAVQEAYLGDGSEVF